MIRLAILALRPFEIWHERRIARLYRKGKFRRPAEGNTAAAVTTKPCGDRNANVCVAEGCYGEACIR